MSLVFRLYNFFSRDLQLVFTQEYNHKCLFKKLVVVCMYVCLALLAHSRSLMASYSLYAHYMGYKIMDFSPIRLQKVI